MATRAHFVGETDNSYDGDYAAWAGAQVQLLRSGRLGEIDAINIAEELGDLGESFYRAMTSAIAIVLAHIAKWESQPERRSRSWTNSIAIHRAHAGDELERSPSLRRRLPEAIGKAWREARRTASSETDLPLGTFPVDCPYSWDEIMTRPFDWPEDAE